MKSRTGTPLLDEVWNALDKVVPRGSQESLVALDLINAVSTDGAAVRVLLRVPAQLCTGADLDELLDDVAGSVRALPGLRQIEFSTHASWPESCLATALASARRDGWLIDGMEGTARQKRPSSEEQPDGIHVTIRARIDAENVGPEVGL